MKSESLSQIDPLFGTVKQKYVRLPIYPKTHYVMKPETRDKAAQSIREELLWWEAELEKQGRLVEAQRVHQRTMYDLEMIKAMGYCHGSKIIPAISPAVCRGSLRRRCLTIFLATF